MVGLTDSSARALLAAPPTRRVLQPGDTYKYQEIDGYLRLPSGSRRDPNTESYRSITKSKLDAQSAASSSDSDEGSADEVSSDEAEGFILTAHQETLRNLEQQLTQDSSSVDKWLQLLTHTLSTIPISSKNASKARSDITISILARALAAHPRNATSKLLRLRYLKAGEEVWHVSKVRAEWEEALKLGGIEIWMEWLEWRIRQAINGVDGVAEDAVRVLGVLGDSELDELAKVRVFWRVAVVFQRAGMKAIFYLLLLVSLNIWQASRNVPLPCSKHKQSCKLFTTRPREVLTQIHRLYEIPQSLYGLPYEMQLEQLEEFWESEVPRVGEDGSQGWAAWVSSGRKEAITTCSTVTKSECIVELDPYRQWAGRETQMDHNNVLPSRSFTETEDPYSTILFSDIKSLLLHLESDAAKNAFRRAWLSLIGLHIPGFSSSSSNTTEINWDDRWNQGYLMQPSYLDALFPEKSIRNRLSTEAYAGVIVGCEKEYASGFGPVKSWGYRVFGPLDAPDLGKGKAVGGIWGREDVEAVDQTLVRRVFSQLRLGPDDVEWDILALAFEVALNIKRHLEIMRGRLDDARKVCQTVLIASPAASSMQGASSLWWNWAQMEWLSGNTTQALNVIMRAAGVEGQGGLAVLRCKRGLDDAAKDEVDWKEREGWIKLRGLLELLVGAGAPAALAVFDHHLFGERKKGARRESLTTASLIMVYQYGVVLKNAMPPAVLRQRVEKALDEYPSNSVLLGLFLEGEKGQGVWGRVRRLLGDNDRKTKDVARRVEEVWIAGWERGRWKAEIERTRSGLADAVENERTRGSAIVWRIYIEFEIRAGELQRAKKLVYRAIGECPLVKAFVQLRGMFSGQELRGLADTMAERGLRMRMGLDEGLEGWEGEVEETMWEGGTDEIEDNARELRRLMPY
ncbi:hypothetical protein H0H81_008346 [Sphagnurus paluster]|uniref:Uncharacterized protein n=1 Tax=Sphagnurus paluster TaxID=117069 RepID=A0A9P7FS88_9AGAR|nr:hypothetical protein H0H81_008346 [Sphagnurus paluster]